MIRRKELKEGLGALRLLSLGLLDWNKRQEARLDGYEKRLAEQLVMMDATNQDVKKLAEAISHLQERGLGSIVERLDQHEEVLDLAIGTRFKTIRYPGDDS